MFFRVFSLDRFFLSLGFLLTHAFKVELFITRGHEAALLVPGGSKTSLVRTQVPSQEARAVYRATSH